MSEGGDAPRADVAFSEREGGAVATVTYYERRLNLVGTPGLAALEDSLAGLRERPDLRAVVLTGAGTRAFVGGADIAEMVELDPGSARAFISRIHAVCRAIRELPVPVVARIEGYCLGAGLEVAACCDLRLAATGARFGMPEVRVGIPSVIEAAMLPRLIGLGRAQDLVLTGRTIEADEALRMGLIDGIAESGRALDALVGERVEQVLAGGARALADQKTLIRQWQELPLGAAIEAGIEAFARSWERDQSQERVESQERDESQENDEPRERMRTFLRRR